METHKTRPVPIDTRSLFERCMSDSRIAALVLEKLEEEIAHDLAALASASGRGDNQALARTAHALKGAAASASAYPLSDAARRVEALAEIRSTAALAHAITDLLHAADECNRALPAARREFQSPDE